MGIALWLVGCAPATTLQQRAAPYPGYGQSSVQLQRDSAECESWATSNAGPDSTTEGAVGGAVLGSAIGAGAGALAGSFFGAADTGAALGAALGGVRGAAGGAANNAAARDQRLVLAYRNCMAARGYVMSGSVVLPPPAPTPTAANAGDPSAPRLDTIERLHAQGLISDSEYAAKIAEVESGRLPVAQRLNELQRLLDAGLITKKEYQQQRARILDDI